MCGLGRDCAGAQDARRRSQVTAGAPLAPEYIDENLELLEKGCR
jgi:hypothetical protein